MAGLTITKTMTRYVNLMNKTLYLYISGVMLFITGALALLFPEQAQTSGPVALGLLGFGVANVLVGYDLGKKQ